LVFYLATGIAVSGYFYLYPNYYQKKRNLQWHEESSYEEGNEYSVSVLITIVGCVLIGGLGIVTKKHE